MDMDGLGQLDGDGDGSSAVEPVPDCQRGDVNLGWFQVRASVSSHMRSSAPLTMRADWRHGTWGTRMPVP
jgi:hypothetical protein